MPVFGERRRQGAFTLVEVLVVCAIVAIVVGLAAVRLDPSDARRLEAAAEALLVQLDTAHDEAVTRGRPVAFSSDGEGYQFWIADPGKEAWLPLIDRPALASGRLADGVRLHALAINGTPRPLGEKLVFSMNGLCESFRLTLAAGNATLALEGDALGRLEIRRVP